MMNQPLICVSLGRRLLSIIYDWLLMLGLILFMYAMFYALLSGEWLESSTIALWLKRIYISLVVACYFIYCWYKGSTLGMKTWHLRVVTASGERPSIGQLIIRFLVASISVFLLGFGFWVALLSRENLAWHDAISNTRLVRIKEK